MSTRRKKHPKKEAAANPTGKANPPAGVADISSPPSLVGNGIVANSLAIFTSYLSLSSSRLAYSHAHLHSASHVSRHRIQRTSSATRPPCSTNEYRRGRYTDNDCKCCCEQRSVHGTHQPEHLLLDQCQYHPGCKHDSHVMAHPILGRSSALPCSHSYNDTHMYSAGERRCF